MENIKSLKECKKYMSNNVNVANYTTQKYKLYFNYAIVHCTKWKIFNLSTARNGKFSASPLHEMESF